MAISKSTPYVRYKKDFTSSLHLGTIHIESEYLDRTQKTTIESIHGMTWHNKVVNENKELNLLSDIQLELTELEKQYWNTGEKRVSVDEIHTLEEVEPNEDGTYTYMVNSMEGEYIEIYDGINNITSTSDGLDGQFEIVYDTTEEDINGNIALDSIVPQYEITDSGVGAITGAKSTGLTLVNHITEPSKEEVVAIGEYEGQYFTIENTVQGNIKSAILKGQTLVNLFKNKDTHRDTGKFIYVEEGDKIKATFKDGATNGWIGFSFKENVPFEIGKTYTVMNELYKCDGQLDNFSISLGNKIFVNTKPVIGINKLKIIIPSDYTEGLNWMYYNVNNTNNSTTIFSSNLLILEGDYTQEDIPYFEGMQSVKMPVLTTVSKNLFDGAYNKGKYLHSDGTEKDSNGWATTTNFIPVKPSTTYTQNIAKNSAIAYVVFYDKQKNVIASISQTISNWSTYTTPSNCYFIKTCFKPVEAIEPYRFQIEEGSIATSYEPHKSNILSVNEEVHLRRIGDVQDELNLLTGELTKRIGEVVISDEMIENVSVHSNFLMAGKILNYFEEEAKLETFSNNFYMISNKMKSINWRNVAPENIVSFSMYRDGDLRLYYGEQGKTLDEWKQWLRENRPTIQYELATPIVKTVDLTVQNQDGNIIPRIQTQQGITHVSTSSDSLVPTVEMSCSYDTIIKPNTTYTIKLDRPIVSDTMYLQVDLGGTMMMLDADVNAFTIKTPSTLSHSQLRLSGTGNTVKEIIVLEGNRVNDKIEYFEGMKNVENPILVVRNCQYVFGKGGRI